MTRPESPDSGGASRPNRRRHPRFPASKGVDPGGAPGITPGSALDPEASTVVRGTQAKPAIALDGVGRRYGERLALDGVTVSVPAGQTLGVFGSNGAGKTTLLRVLATLLRPHSGSARVLDAELPRDAWRVRGRIGFLGHEPLLYRDLTARENLTFHARLHGVETARVEELVDAVRLTRRADEPISNLSRGMVQRVAVARAVLHDPPVLLLDEPRANLDPAAAALLEPMIGRESGRTRVLVTHDVEGGLAESDVVLGLKRGRVDIAAPKATVDELRGLYS